MTSRNRARIGHRPARAALAIGFAAAITLAIGAAPASATGSPTGVAAGVGTGRDAPQACIRVAQAAGDIGAPLTLANAVFTGGTPGNDIGNTGGSPVEPGEPIPVFCGFAGDDLVSDNWGYYYGGPGNDITSENWLVFRGGPGNDSAGPNEA